MSHLASEPIPFIAASPEEAVAKIRARLGPDAVVLNVRPIQTSGLARFWQKPMIEVLAHRPDPPLADRARTPLRPVPVAAGNQTSHWSHTSHPARTPLPAESLAPEPPLAPDPPLTEALAEFRQELDEIKQQIELQNSGWRVAPLLQKTGLLPLHAKQILDSLKSACGDIPPSSLADEIAMACGQLAKTWRAPRPCAQRSIHVFVGPSGSGKTTVLCKWLTSAVLLDGRSARVWRLDGATANNAEYLSVHCEALNAPADRCWTAENRDLAEDIGFIDLPAADWRNPQSIRDLAAQLVRHDSPHIHLVLNGAYDTAVMLAQARAFAALPLEDMIVTHLDEEPHWGKLWNLTLGANLPLRYLSAGPSIPGDFCEATPEKILSRQFPRRPAPLALSA